MTDICQEVIKPIPFKLGRIVITRGIDELVNGVHEKLIPFLDRHDSCDWGSTCEEDSALNNEGTHDGGRIMSEYHYDDIKIWIITESDRSATTFLLPSEY